jgi:5-methyltetrahydrofolate--homocysteine methyltransferase
VTDFLRRIAQAIAIGDDRKAVQTVEEAIANGMLATDILHRGLVSGIQALGDRFKGGEVYLPEVMISARAMNKGVQVLKPYFTRDEIGKQGTVALGTIEGDLHDIGKKLVKMMLEGNEFRVIDMGVDVSPTSFVDAAREEGVDIIAISSLLTTTMNNIPKVIDALEKSGLKDKVRVMIGGAPVTREFADSIEIEGFAEDCVSAVDEAKRLMAMK